MNRIRAPNVFGSSPLARGTHLKSLSYVTELRLIPARAGNTRYRHYRRGSAAAHPRSRGEHVVVLGQNHAAVGSSPLARGTPLNVFRKAGSARLIPARAGNTLARGVLLIRVSAHPRSRGEHPSQTPKASSVPGSSPLARGTLMSIAISHINRRLIPARAGNTRYHR